MTGGFPVGELLWRARRDGVRSLALRAIYEAYHRTGAERSAVPILEDDIVSSLEIAPRAARAPLAPAGRQRIAWITAPPSPGSGGHTTLFRMVAALAARGHKCTIALYDPRGSEPARHRERIAEGWPWLGVGRDVQVVDVGDGLAGFDSVVASSWQTAHVAAGRAAGRSRLFYFVQDFEPYFYPRGAFYALAEDTYHFGMTNIALGRMVAECLDAIGAPYELVPFGCDTSAYRRMPGAARDGVSAYLRVMNDRRGYLLIRAALERFHALRPEQAIHVYGDDVTDWRIPVVSHGRLTPAELNRLYNSVHGGLAMSFTNVSLVAGEMLAAGAVPVQNDNRLARLDLEHPDAVWAAPDPASLAQALADVVDRSLAAGGRRELSDFTPVGWEATQTAVAGILEGTAGSAAFRSAPSLEPSRLEGVRR